MSRTSLVLTPAVVIIGSVLAASPQTPPAPVPPDKPVTTGNVERGRPLYLDFGCYACHGYNAQTGNGPRLQPPRMNERQFVLYLRAPRTMQMPAYTAKVMTDGEAADIYAYVLSLPREPAAADVPLLDALPR